MKLSNLLMAYWNTQCNGSRVSVLEVGHKVASHAQIGIHQRGPAPVQVPTKPPGHGSELPLGIVEPEQSRRQGHQRAELHDLERQVGQVRAQPPMNTITRSYRPLGRLGSLGATRRLGGWDLCRHRAAADAGGGAEAKAATSAGVPSGTTALDGTRSMNTDAPWPTNRL